ncbi:MAG TPA: hypothetical protein PLY76_13770, partial [Flavobacteriales bacterium]|nr:hypothetical protein [Flavobacteriales bacterium]
PYPGARLFAECLLSRGLWPFQLSFLWHEPPRSSYFMRQPYPGARLFAECLLSRGLWPFQLSLLWHEPPRSSYFMRQLLNARAS